MPEDADRDTGAEDAHCGFLVVPENRTKANGRTIELAVAIVAAASRTPAPDPIVHLTGGPGGIAILEAQRLVDAGLNRDRDLILMDQRGTLYSKPAITCPEIDRFNARALGPARPASTPSPGRRAPWSCAAPRPTCRQEKQPPTIAARIGSGRIGCRRTRPGITREGGPASLPRRHRAKSRSHIRPRGAILLSKRSRHLSLLVGALAVVSLLQVASAAALEPSSNAKARGCRTGGVHDVNRVLPEWVGVRRGDAAQVAEGVVRSSNVAYHDFPFSHVSHDWNWDLVPDPAYQFLNGTDNASAGSSRQMEIEWEEKFFPPAFRPAVGDRAWMLGRWVFDCGHSPYLTEIHPPKAVAHTRFAPTILPGDAAPSLTNKTFIWIHGRGGYYNRSVAQQNYDFDIALPPRPELAVQQNRASAAAVAPPVAFGPEPRAAILSRVGSVTPVLSFVPAGAPTRVHVHYPLASLHDSSPNRQFGATIAAGWREPSLGRAYRQLCVKFENIKVLHDHDPFASGEWRLRLFGGQQWVPLSARVNSDLNDVDDGQTVALHDANDHRCGAIFNVTDPGGSVRIETTGWESDPIDSLFGSGGNILRLADDNDQIGVVRRVFNAAANLGIGPHSDLSSSGDFRLRYVISELHRFPAGTAVR